ncbi:MAG TPA: bifunctional adenosylcobinamide kinase/adenosylcobinamide-phosphate guanylyltransferase [Gemmatimonadota bacterium]|nr:bifunctional adenosylcobinamide kinase/adenosylcobinamide-phosphate guanylyltransferase [Gemmatimonadota bacterium]
MRIALVTGGVRSGKSAWAQERARSLGGERVTVVATAEPGDPEMEARIAAHRESRPARWTTVEAPFGAGPAITAATTDVIVLECLTMACANALADGPERMEAELGAILSAADGREGDLVVVTNEVGLGLVPATPSGRAFRDALGAANRRVAERAEEVVMMVAGIPLQLKHP